MTKKDIILKITDMTMIKANKMCGILFKKHLMLS